MTKLKLKNALSKKSVTSKPRVFPVMCSLWISQQKTWLVSAKVQRKLPSTATDPSKTERSSFRITKEHINDRLLTHRTNFEHNYHKLFRIKSSNRKASFLRIVWWNLSFECFLKYVFLDCIAFALTCVTSIRPSGRLHNRSILFQTNVPLKVRRYRWKHPFITE